MHSAMVTIAAAAFVLLAALLALFQLALVAGAPLGHLTQGGTHPGRLPPANRAVAGVSALLAAAFVGIVLTRVGWVAPERQAAARLWVWGVVDLSALSLLANAASRSRAERALWVPVAMLMLATSLVVALSGA